MTSLPMLRNILGQPDSLAGVVERQTGAGAADLQACARLLQQCTGRIVITGMGASLFASLPAAQALEAAGRHVLHAEASELLHYGANSWHPDDVAILISRSGGSIETLEVAAQLARRGIKFLAVTNVEESSLTAAAEATLVVGSAADEMVAVQTYVGTLLALLLLVEQAGASGDGSLSGKVRALLPTLTQHIGDSVEQSEGWREFFAAPDPLYLLGRGGALASLHEGALLFHETAKAAVIPLSSGQFRHGPVEVVGPAFRAVLLGSPAATRALDWQLAQDLRAMGGNVRWIGPSSGDSPASLVRWPADVPEALLPLFDIVPLQVAAYRLALWRDIRPGSFRYVSEVTDRETGFSLLPASQPNE